MLCSISTFHSWNSRQTSTVWPSNYCSATFATFVCWRPLAISVDAGFDACDYPSAKCTAGLFKHSQRAICKKRLLACGRLTFYLCNEYALYYSFVMLGNVPKSNCAGMIIEESGDWDKWSPIAQCTVTIHQPQAAGMLLQGGLMEKTASDLFSPSLPCSFCTAARRTCLGLSDWGFKIVWTYADPEETLRLVF